MQATVATAHSKPALEQLLPEPCQQGVYYSSSKVTMTPSQGMLKPTAGQEQGTRPLSGKAEVSPWRLPAGGEMAMGRNSKGLSHQRERAPRSSSEKWPGQPTTNDADTL